MSRSRIETLTLEDLVNSSPVIVRAVPDGAPRMKRVVFDESSLPRSHPLRPPAELKIPLHPFRVAQTLKASRPVAERIEVMTRDAEQSLDWATRMHRDGVSKSYIVPRYDSGLGQDFGNLGGRAVLLFLEGRAPEFTLSAQGAFEDPVREPDILRWIQTKG